jgi:uncharacterized protein YbjQ (UPF0145 family)
MRLLSYYYIYVLVVTIENLPGFEIRAVLGEVLGVTACTRNPFVAGQGAGMAKVLVQSRASAITQMINAAQRRGATAVIGMRFDNRDITGNWVELCAYGTAVVAVATSDVGRMPAIDADGVPVPS